MYSDDPYINAVVTNYAEIFAKNDTTFEHDIKLGKMEVHHVEMCLILNNALQNALEASLKLPPKQRYVKLQIKMKQNHFLLRITNRFDGELMMHCGIPRSTKENAGHGYGLVSIRDAAESSGGFMVCKSENDIFILDVAIIDFKPSENVAFD
jgi:sensor histidine kinase regulating citrate/malate metabolism